MSPDDEISRHLGLVDAQARALVRRLPPSVTFDELRAAGLVGLWQAIERFDAGRGVPFPAYARRRIKGAMLDDTRSLYGRGRVVTEALPDGLACHMDEETVAMRGRLEREIDALPPHWREIIRRVYWRGDTCREIAAERGVTPGAISIQRTRAVARLAERMA